MTTLVRVVLVLAAMASAASVTMKGQGQPQTLSGDARLTALRQGGYVIVMRHATSPRQAPDEQAANADNINVERQLDEAGRASGELRLASQTKDGHP